MGYSILTGNDADNGGPEVTLAVLSTVAKISISDADNTRGYEMTVTGSGFNNGTTADVFVLSGGAMPADVLGTRRQRERRPTWAARWLAATTRRP